MILRPRKCPSCPLIAQSSDNMFHSTYINSNSKIVTNLMGFFLSKISFQLFSSNIWDVGSPIPCGKRKYKRK
jgi:hypothetical protein